MGCIYSRGKISGRDSLTSKDVISEQNLYICLMGP